MAYMIIYQIATVTAHYKVCCITAFASILTTSIHFQQLSFLCSSSLVGRVPSSFFNCSINAGGSTSASLFRVVAVEIICGNFCILVFGRCGAHKDGRCSTHVSYHTDAHVHLYGIAFYTPKSFN